MNRKDLTASAIIGGAVGLLIQPILANTVSSISFTIVDRIGIFVFFAVIAPFALWICSLIGKIWKGFYQFGKFGAVGTLNSFIDIGVFNLEAFLYGTGTVGTLVFAIFKAISFLCATTNSFFWNKEWTFSDRDKAKGGQVAGFYSIAIVGWVLNVALATAVKVIGPADSKVWVDIVAPLSGIAASFLWNFFGYKYWVFKKQSPQGLQNPA